MFPPVLHLHSVAFQLYQCCAAREDQSSSHAHASNDAPKLVPLVDNVANGSVLEPVTGVEVEPMSSANEYILALNEDVSAPNGDVPAPDGGLLDFSSGNPSSVEAPHDDSHVAISTPNGLSDCHPMLTRSKRVKLSPV
ncbi:hypothetical protein V6N13_072961 [Hibiscus sabdariffa]